MISAPMENERMVTRMDEEVLNEYDAICGATNLPCIKCNPGGCNNRKEGAD